MDIELAYGRIGARITVPDENLVAVVEPRWPAVLARPREAVAEALARPVAGPPLAQIVAERVGQRNRSVGSAEWRRDWRSFRAVILVSDRTRPCPNRHVLRPILEELGRAGVPNECITVMIATGLHAPVTGGAARRLVGDEIVEEYRVVNHFGHRPVTLADLGRTPSGTPVVLARDWVEADLRIATGVIEPHLMAGFSGGRKAVCPGIAGDETVRAWHSPRFLEHPRALPGFLEGNPSHEEALAVADFAPPHFLVNVTVDRRESLTGVFAGQMRAAHEAGVEFLRQHVARPVREPCDILVTTNGGWPLDGTYYQCQKGLLTGLPILKAGGTFLFAAACEEGLGQQEFTGLIMKYKSLDEFMAAITAPGAAVVKDQWGLENLAKAARHAEIMFWSDRLPQSLQERLFVRPVPILQKGLAQAIARHGPQARVTVMPWGPYVLPYLDGT
ncbi:MAG: nickel-dependent lactate racemase [Planctomycetes bacterium]|nr:nickel-dependent lactate racemase [Planctomycetota bacterium]